MINGWLWFVATVLWLLCRRGAWHMNSTGHSILCLGVLRIHRKTNGGLAVLLHRAWQPDGLLVLGDVIIHDDVV